MRGVWLTREGLACYEGGASLPHHSWSSQALSLGAGVEHSLVCACGVMEEVVPHRVVSRRRCGHRVQALPP